MSTTTDAKLKWSAFSEHRRLMHERNQSLDKVKQENTLYLPLLGSTWNEIEDDCAQKQLDAAMTLLNKCVYILRGTRPTSPVFGGLVRVECLGRSCDRNVCVYLGGPLMNESGVIYEDLIVRVAVLAHTYISYR